MTHIQKHFYIVLIGLFFLPFNSGCGKSDLSVSDYDITCYTATYSEGVYRSDNGGTSWYPLDIDQEDLYLYFKKLFIHPEKNELYVATTGAGLFIIDLENETLNDVIQFSDESIRSIAFKSGLAGRESDVEIFAGMNSRGIFITQPGSGIWQALNKGLAYRDVNTFLVLSKDLYAGTVNDLYKWDEASKNWKASSEGIKNKNIISMNADPKGDILYAGSGTYQDEKGFFENIPCLYKSADKGHTWEVSDRGLPDDTLVYVFAVNPQSPERIYIGTSDGIYRSVNSGKKWNRMKHGLPDESRVFDIKIARTPDGKDVVYAAGSKGIYMAMDEKSPQWEDKSYGLPQTSITSIILGFSPN